MTRAVVRTWLKVNDPTALTATTTLQRALAYGRVVRSAARSRIWSFSWEGTVDARSALKRLVEETNLIRNPNKHFLEVRVGDEALTPRGNAWVLVYTEGEGADLEDTLRRHRLMEGEVPSVGSATLWELDLEADPAERNRIAEEIAVVRSRKAGLLANPHTENVVLFEAPPMAGELAEILRGTRQEAGK